MGEGEGSEFPPKPAEQSENQSSDFPTKKLARQLDFTLGNVNVTLRDHPQSQPPATAPVVSPSPPQPPVIVVSALAPPLQQHPQARALKPESPKSKPRSNSEPKDGTPKRPKQCNCKHSRCLKLYCECFASGTYCDGCNCANCYNNVEHEAARREAVEATLERNPNAFRPKIANSPHGPRDNREENKVGAVLPKHNKGCHCKKSGCLKKYCECFQAGILCSENCKCMDCKNFEGSEERQALYHGHHTNDIAHIQQAANAAITGAIGSSGYTSPPVTKRRKGQELLFGPTLKDPSFHRVGQFHQAVHTRPSAPSSSLSSNPTARAVNTAAAGPSKFTYRSLLADIIQPQDLKELCSVLVVLSTEAAKTLTDQRTTTEKHLGQTETSLSSGTNERLQSQNEAKSGAHNATATGSSSANSGDNAGPDDATSSKERPMSPGTLELMCDEKDTIFTAPASPSGLTGEGHSNTSQLPLRQGVTEIYAEQERIVLTKFRDCLNRLITFGEIKETKCSSSARTESGNQKDAIPNGTLNHVISPTSKPSPMAASAVAQSSTELSRNSAVPQNGNSKPKS